jgi:hypothetical protein
MDAGGGGRGRWRQRALCAEVGWPLRAGEIAETLAMPLSTVSGILTRSGMGRLGRLGLEPAVRYERSRPGELVHGVASARSALESEAAVPIASVPADAAQAGAGGLLPVDALWTAPTAVSDDAAVCGAEPLPKRLTSSAPGRNRTSARGLGRSSRAGAGRRTPVSGVHRSCQMSRKSASEAASRRMPPARIELAHAV